MYKQRYFVTGHLVLFLLFLLLLPQETIYGFEQVLATFVIALLTTYGITLDWKKSFWIGLLFAFLMELINPDGPFDNLRSTVRAYRKSGSPVGFIRGVSHNLEGPISQKFEHFEEKKLQPAGSYGKDEGKAVSEKTTHEKDTTSFQYDDLEQMLKEDEKENKEEFKKQGGALAHLDTLLSNAKQDSPYTEKDLKDYTPAQAQKATYRLIDTVKQLKETMESMAPVMKTGKRLMDLYKGLDVLGPSKPSS